MTQFYSIQWLCVEKLELNQNIWKYAQVKTLKNIWRKKTQALFLCFVHEQRQQFLLVSFRCQAGWCIEFFDG